MKCPKCNSEIANDSKFCEFCGAKVAVESIDVKKSKKSIGWLIGGIVALVIVVIALVTIFVREHKAAMVTDIFMRLNEQEQIIKSCGDIVIVPNGTPTNDFEQIAYKLKNCEEVQVEERNTMTVMVNSDNNILVNGEPINISELNTKVKDFLGNPNNNPDLSDKEVKSIPELGDYFVSKGVIFLQKKGNVDTNFCRNVEFELENAIYEMRVELSYNIFNTYFSILEDENQSMAIREAIPLAIIK